MIKQKLHNSLEWAFAKVQLLQFQIFSVLTRLCVFSLKTNSRFYSTNSCTTMINYAQQIPLLKKICWTLVAIRICFMTVIVNITSNEPQYVLIYRNLTQKIVCIYCHLFLIFLLAAFRLVWCIISYQWNFMSRSIIDLPLGCFSNFQKFCG